MSAYDESGNFVHHRVGLSIPRQVGKSYIVIIWVIFLVLAGYTVLWTDHNYSTTCEMLGRFKDIFGAKVNDKSRGIRWFNKQLVRVSNKTAQEAFFFKSGGSLHFSTRTKSAALGYSFDVVVYDEAQELMDEHVQAITPTTSAGSMQNAQFIYAGTPRRMGSQADVFENMRNEFNDDSHPQDACWWEWSVSQPFDLDDDDLMMAKLKTVNPSLGRSANVSSIVSGIRQMTPMAALQEYFGYWLPPSGVLATLFKNEEWEALCVDSPMTDGQRSYGVKFSADGLHVAVCVAVYKPGSPIFVDGVFVRRLKGKRWLVEWLALRADAAGWIAIDGKSGAQNLYELLCDCGVMKSQVHIMSTGDMVAACSNFESAISEKSIAHVGQEALQASVCGCVKRQIGNAGGWGLGSSELAESTLAEAAVVAIWAALNTPRRIDKEASIG
ncbi:MAG: hypothetical protein KBT28_12365 [Bacteroidales bacterium]|nr:hypothetical protein [Candidatus Colimorpha merdihippi]